MTDTERCAVICAYKIRTESVVDLNNPKTEKPQLVPYTLSAIDSDIKHVIQQESLIGREVECAISLDSPHISRYHAKILIHNDGVTIEDLNSSNGTYVNGARIKAKTAISIGDEIKFDTLVFRLTSPDAGKRDETVVSAQPHTEQDNIIKDATPHDIKQAIAKPAPALAETLDGDNTRMLSTEQIDQIASINKKYSKLADTGSGPRLIATTAPIRGKVFAMVAENNQITWQLGRNIDNDICVSDPSVSRNHAIIEKRDGRFYIRSNGNNHSFLLNGNTQTSTLLRHNDHLQFGHVEFVFRLDEQDTQAPQLPQEPSLNINIKMLAGIVVAILCCGFALAAILNI